MRNLRPISPMHPLTAAAREVNALADDTNLDNVLDQIGMGVGTEQLMYLAQQRAIRTLAAVVHKYDMGHDFEKDEEMAQEIVKSDEWRIHSAAIIAAYMDGMAIGWRGAQLMAGDQDEA